MTKKTRPIEMYIGEGSDFGTWHTEYVDIPIDTPEDKIEQVAKDQARNDFTDFVSIGVYSIVPLEEIEGWDEVYN